MSTVINTPPKNYEEENEEFSIIVSPYNDNILPRVNPLDLQKENDYFWTDCQEGKGQNLILVFCRVRILSSILFEELYVGRTRKYAPRTSQQPVRSAYLGVRPAWEAAGAAVRDFSFRSSAVSITSSGLQSDAGDKVPFSSGLRSDVVSGLRSDAEGKALVLPQVKGRARDDGIAHTTASVFSWEFVLIHSLIWHKCS
uniref:Uncharacterized protein n=1 Tax=Lactuca sativa TaxID=4236 RepID=A0A9R1WQ27_LACSA|nr:hypothetical protein LSAT_V11C100004930 [Lactuca sativa]